MKALFRRLAPLYAICLGLALYVAPAHAGGTFDGGGFGGGEAAPEYRFLLRRPAKPGDATET